MTSCTLCSSAVMIHVNKGVLAEQHCIVTNNVQPSQVCL